MLDWKLYVSSAIFIVVTVLKLLLPEQTVHVRQEVVRLIDMDMDYRALAVQAGSLLTDESVEQVFALIRGEGQQQEAEDEEVQAEVSEFSPTPSPSPTPTILPVTPVPGETTDSSPEPAETSNVLSAIEVFKTAQEAYVGYATPDKVSYGNLCIPFSYSSPVTGVTSSGFGYRVHPIEGVVKFHYGTDYSVETGTPITAFADGEVSMTGYEAGYGNFVEITHADGWKTLYAHCEEISVELNQTVKMGDVIALSGETGATTGPHLHLELSCDGYYTNPEFFF